MEYEKWDEVLAPYNNAVEELKVKFKNIRKEFLKLENQEIKVYMPDLKLCTDNAAMIASAGYYNFIEGNRSSLDLNAIPNLKLQ